MAPRRAERTALLPLTDEQVDRLRAEVGEGRSPRVIVRTPSAGLAAGTRGPVVRVGDPAVDAECVVVALNGDEIPFAPSELALTGPAGRQVAPAASQRSKPARRAAAKRAPVATKRGTPSPVTPKVESLDTPGSAAHPPAAPRASAPRASRPSKRKPPSPVTLTLRFGDGAWTAEAARGGKRVGGKAVPVRAGAVAALAELIDDPHVSGVIAETVAACRSEVEERAAQLRAQLAAAEQALKEYER